MATTTQDPAVQNPDAGVADVSRSPKERVGGIISALTGGQSGKLDDAIAAHHQKRLDQARRSRQEWSTYHSIALTGTNPDTGQPLSDEEKAQYQNWAESAWADYEKAAGVNPQAKKSLQQNKGIIDRVSQFIQQRQQGQGGSAAPGSLPAPPAATPAATDATATEGEHPSAGLPPPPQATTTPHTAQVAADAPRLAAVTSAQRADKRELDMYTAKQKALYEQKMDLEEAKAKARAANPTVSRYSPKIMGNELPPDPVDVRNNPITPEMAGPQTVWTTFDGGGHFLQVSDDYQLRSVGNITGLYSKRTGELVRTIGQTNLGSETDTTDPATGQVARAVRTPKTAPMGSLPGPPAAKSSATPTAAAAPAGGGTPRNTPAAASAAPPPPLDDGGHIPAAAASSTPGMTPQVIEGANQLLDGKDVKDLPAKTKELSASLARKYGWEQGKFTPREQGALRNATQFIDDMLSDPATLAVLDSATSRLKLNQVMAGTNKQQGMIGGALSTLAAGNMSDAEAKFQRQFNIIAQTIAGIAPAVRGSGSRTTEAAIQRLLTDMPNPKTVQGSKDATQRLQLLKKEIQRALVKGKFTDVGQAAEKAGSLPKPLSVGAPPPLSDAAKAYVRENHPNVVVP